MAPLGRVLRAQTWHELSTTSAPLHLLVGQLVEVLQSSHAKGIIHRDVRPNNIIITASQPPHLFIIDWGCAVCVGSSGTHPGPYSGTTAYASDSVLQQCKAKGFANVLVSATDDLLVSLVRGIYTMRHPEFQQQLRMLPRGDVSAAMEAWSHEMANRHRSLRQLQQARRWHTRSAGGTHQRRLGPAHRPNTIAWRSPPATD